jgi:hypothetical protein
MTGTPLTTLPGGRPGWARPVAHDVPYPACGVCRFPIPARDLAGDEYHPRHASTCTSTTSSTTGSAAASRSASGDPIGTGEAAAPGAAVQTTPVVGVGGRPTVPPLTVKPGPRDLSRVSPSAALRSAARSDEFQTAKFASGGSACSGLDSEPPAARRVAGGAGTACLGNRPPHTGGTHPMNTRQPSQPRRPSTHELYLHAVRDVVVTRATVRGTISAAQAERLAHTKLLYGIGDGTYRGVTVYGAWHHGDNDDGGQNGGGRVDIVEVAATGQESWVQLAGTVIHELAHVLAGHAAGHSTAWKDTAVALGFTMRPAAAGQVYHLAMIEPTIRRAVHELAQRIGDGRPEFRTYAIPAPTTSTGARVAPRPCSAGVGTRGGASRGKGSGSRMRLWQCGCAPRPVKVRVASDDFQATCQRCGTAFKRADQPASGGRAADPDNPDGMCGIDGNATTSAVVTAVVDGAWAAIGGER